MSGSIIQFNILSIRYKPQVCYGRVAEAGAEVAASAPRCEVFALSAHEHSRSRGARDACVPPSRTRALPYLPSPSPARDAHGTAHASRVQILQHVARSSTLNRARSPNMCMYQCNDICPVNSVDKPLVMVVNVDVDVTHEQR